MRQLRVNQGSGYGLAMGQQMTNLALTHAPSGPKALLFDQSVGWFALELANRLNIKHTLGLAAGEGCKTLEVFGQCLSWLAQAALPRNTTLYVVGGGTLTDLGGFVAASYLRGIGLISFPTSTLAMVDASVGGKTGLNLPEGKNLVGAFYPAQAVYIDLTTLDTLPQPLFKEGLVEAFKHGLISGDTRLLQLDDLAPTWSGLEDYLWNAVHVKVKIVEADPFEQGVRKHLNLGHTLGHALEGVTGHRISHGHAVAYGLVYAALLGQAVGGMDLLPVVQKLLNWLKPQPLPPIAFDQLLPFLSRDKKKVGQSLSWVVPLAPGRLEVRPVEDKVLLEVYGRFADHLSQHGLWLR